MDLLYQKVREDKEAKKLSRTKKGEKKKLGGARDKMMITFSSKARNRMKKRKGREKREMK